MNPAKPVPNGGDGLSPGSKDHRLMIAFKPDHSSDILLQAFSNIGNHCMFCSVKSNPDDMVLCQCGDFMCITCFLNGNAPCRHSVRRVKNDVKDKAGDGDKSMTTDKVTPDDFELTAQTSTTVNLDGDIRPIDFKFEYLRSELKK